MFNNKKMRELNQDIKLIEQKIQMLEKHQQGQIKKIKVRRMGRKGRRKWCAYTNNGRIFYAKRAVLKNGKTKTIKMHNIILGFKGIDHINGNGLDNRRNNLRPATKSQNGMKGEKNENSV